MLEQYVTRTLQIVECKAWKPTGAVLEDGTPEQVCVGSAESVVTRMNKQVAREILKDAHVDLKGCTVTWAVSHIGTYGMPVDVFFGQALQVTRAANGAVTLCE